MVGWMGLKHKRTLLFAACVKYEEQPPGVPTFSCQQYLGVADASAFVRPAAVTHSTGAMGGLGG